MKLKQNTRITTLTLAAMLSFGLSLGFPQVPFTEVADPGDLALDYRSNVGTSWGDFDGDGDVDLLVVNALQQGNLIYRNNGDLSFTRMTAADIGDLGNDTSDGSVGIWADIDNDGDLDLYIANFSMATELSDYNNAQTAPQPDRLYLNNGDNTFTRQPDALFGPPYRYSNGASMADFDGNGFLDIVTPTFPVPLNGAALPDVLYANHGDLTFSSVNEITQLTGGWAAAWADYDGDGDMDVLVPNTKGNSWLYVNQKQETGVATFVPRTQFPNGVALLSNAINGFWGDYDNDGDWDFILNRYTGGVFLYSNLGDGAFSTTRLLTDYTKGARGGAWFDYDNDGDLDLFLETIAQDRSADGFLLLENLGSGSFSEHVFLPKPPSGVGHRSALADINDDGFTDVFTAFSTVEATGSPSQERDRLWTNNGNANHWLKLVLKGTHSNRSAVGATIRVRATMNGNVTWQMRQVTAGASLWAQHDPRPNFGLGDAAMAEVVRIEWPSGEVQELTNVAANQILHVVEPPRIRWDSPTALSWPANADTFQLQSAGQPDGPWTNATETVGVSGARKTATLQTTQPAKFYRLVKAISIN